MSESFLTYEGSEHNSYTVVDLLDGREKIVLNIPPSAFRMMVKLKEDWDDKVIVSDCPDLSDPVKIQWDYETGSGCLELFEVPWDDDLYGCDKYWLGLAP